MDTVCHYSLKKDIDSYRRRGMYSRLTLWKIRPCHVCIDTPSQSEAHFLQRYLHSAHDLETVVVWTPPLASAHKCGFECGLLFLVPTPQVPWVAVVSKWGQTEGWLLAVWVGSAKERKNIYIYSKIKNKCCTQNYGTCNFLTFILLTNSIKLWGENETCFKFIT